MFVTEGASAWFADVTADDLDRYAATITRKGKTWMRYAMVTTPSDDLAFLAYQCWVGMSDFKRRGLLENDWMVTNDVLDNFVSDHDAELLVETVPEIAWEAVGTIGGMSVEVTAVHTVLLRIVGTMREAWQRDEEEEERQWRESR